MGNKRKLQEEQESRISKKIRKLERKLKRRRRIISSEDSDSDKERQILPVQSPYRSMSPVASSRASRLSQSEEVDLEMTNLVSSVPQASTCEQTNLVPGQSSALELGNMDITSNQEEETPLEEDVLQILGEAPQPNIALGKNIHKDIAARWQDILIKGLPKEIKESILKKYLIPANCHFLVAPILNPEAKAAVSDTIAKRDATLLQKQNQIGVAIAALSQLTEMILRNETSKQTLLQPLSDACRILCDSHNIETKTRRSIIMSSTNTTLRDTLTNADRDKYLFGDDLTEKLKIAKTVQKTGESLTKNNLTSANKGVNYKSTPKNRNLNYRGSIHKKPPFRANESPRGRFQPRQTRNATTYPRSQPPPLPKASSPARRTFRR